ncbi:TPA: glutamated carboxypeptidase, variant 2 [Trebouxia sp. C0005]
MVQADVHAAYGGVVPNLAMEAHKAAMDSCVEDALQQAGVTAQDLSAVAVSVGPGLSLCLQVCPCVHLAGLATGGSCDGGDFHVGVRKAHQLAQQHQLKLVPVHHMEAHALVARLAADVPFPFLCMLVSGGHNMLLVAHAVGDYTLMGSTLDDSVGEAFDKIARLLGLDLRPNGGAALEAFAKRGDPHRYPFPVPLRRNSDCNFSYAGLKNSVRLAIQAEAPGEATAANEQVRADIAASFQRVAITHLTERCCRAAVWAKESHPDMQTLIVAGGVACNQTLRASLDDVAQEAGLNLVCPPARLCTDNGVMVAWAGAERLQLGLWQSPQQDLGAGALDVRPRWPLTDRRDSRSMPAKKSMRKSRIFTSLTDLTAEALSSNQHHRATTAAL